MCWHFTDAKPISYYILQYHSAIFFDKALNIRHHVFCPNYNETLL